ncbi:MAG TPA: class I SAM-dependent methyltransferase [Hymenobacter sp.]|jgi:predicted O-methyltransferase YrrM|uniref:class I SAM-dependent methyltransferase n=1 Tax=Hymenobacter sp. TaxID=1898978 RepID=UPI002ED9CD09
MNRLLENIFITKSFKNSAGLTVNIHSETSKEQCEFLQRIIRENNFHSSIEIGFAYGMSTLAIVEQIEKNNGTHLVIDKFQHSGWSGNGLDLIEQAGYADNLEFVEEFCYISLPKILASGRKFDFAYIDSTKQMDWLLVNFFYLDKLLSKNGIIVFDDVDFPGIRKLLRYISQFPSYEVYAQYPENRNSTTGNYSKLLTAMPKAKKFLKEEILISDSELGIDASCVALKKTNDDARNWDWHVSF